MTIDAITPIYVRLETVGSTPNSAAANAVDTAELLFTKDTGQLFVGPNANTGNPYSNRAYFPYDNIEVLTEYSPRNKEIFQIKYRNQHSRDFYNPATVIANSGWTPLLIRKSDGAIQGNILPIANSISSVVEYHAVSNSVAVKSGSLRILATTANVAVSDSGISNTAISFNVTYNAYDGQFTLLVKNTGNTSVQIYARQTTIFNNGAPEILSPPVWVTHTGSLGSYAANTNIRRQVYATDPNNLPLTYFIVSGNLGTGLQLLSSGRIIGAIGNSCTFTVRASDGYQYADQVFSITAT